MEIVVVENDSRSLSAQIVDEVAQTTGARIHYRQEPRRGIPFARNKGLTEAVLAGAQWIGLIDDDERVERQWLVRMAAACQSHQADVGQGPVRRIYEVAAPRWWRAQVPREADTGTLIASASTNNALIHARLVRDDGLALRFDERLTFGNEDLDFFERAQALGAKMIWVADAWVEEYIPAARVRPARLISRVHMASAADTFNSVLRKGRLASGLGVVPRSLRRILVGSLAMVGGLVIWPMRGEAFFFYGAIRVARGTGNLRGLLGYKHRYYDRIDGS